MFKPLSHQESFSSLELSSLSKSKTAEFLEEVNNKVNWNKVEKLLAKIYCPDINGRPGFSPIILFRGLLLEQWYQLSDPALEEELKDRLSFRNFVGLNTVQDSPDETTFVRFRQSLQRHSLEETSFNMIRDDLRGNNLEIKQGKCLITDASLIESPYGTEPKGKDNNGDFVQRNGEVRKGYKVHLISNQKDDLVETAKLTFASCHESRFLEDTMAKVSGPVASVLADKGYASDHRKQDYREKGIYYGILEKARINQPLSDKQKKKNKRISRIRSRIERIFAVIKKHYGFSRVRYFGLRNNAGHLWYVLVAYNIQHAVLNGP